MCAFLEILSYMLPLTLIAAMLGWLACVLWRRHGVIAPTIRKHWKAILTIVGIFLFLLVDLPYLIKGYPGLTSPMGKYWLQVVAGNWSPPQDAAASIGSSPRESAAVTQALVPTISAYGYAFSIVLAILLNNALYVAIIGITWTIATRRDAMDNADVLLISMGYIQNAMENILEEDNKFSDEDQSRIVALLNQAFIKGARDTAENISTLGSTGKTALAASQLQEFTRRAASVVSPVPR